ncbi:MAG: exopolysaccharide biosynthesis polyprenyl glycosylphosphotransferase [Flavobacterium sp.]
MTKKKIHFELSERKLLLRIVDVVVVLFALYLQTLFFDFTYFTFSKATFYWSVLFVVYLLLFGGIFEMYNLQVASQSFEVLKSTLLTTTFTFLVYLFTPILSPKLPDSRLDLMVFFVTVFMSLYAWRIFYARLLATNRFAQNVILICDKAQVQQLVLDLHDADPYYRIIGYVNSDTSDVTDFDSKMAREIPIKKLTKYVNRYKVSEIVVASQKTDGITTDLYHQLLQLLESGTSIREYVHVFENKTQRIPVHQIEEDFYRFFPFSRSNSNKLYLYQVRLFEVITSLIGLSIAAMMVPFLVVANWFWNKGSLFYTQERVGKDGALFDIYKFRSMVENAEVNGAAFSKNGDTRVTAFGKFLRKTRIDEFPQFLNIIKGDMAVIGPRPERPMFVKEISAIMPFYETRHIIKPGLTGWAQVNYNYGESIEESLIKLQYDLYYIKHRSVILDTTIIFKTISTVVFYRGQ